MVFKQLNSHHGGDVCVLCLASKKSLPSGNFLFLPERTENFQEQ